MWSPPSAGSSPPGSTRSGWLESLDSHRDSQQSCRVKTTIDLPPELLREMKLRAVHQGRKLKDVAAEMLQRGMACPESPARRVQKPRITLDPGAGFPVVRSRRSSGFIPPTMAESLALIEQANEQEDLRRVGLAD